MFSLFFNTDVSGIFIYAEKRCRQKLVQWCGAEAELLLPLLLPAPTPPTICFGRAKGNMVLTVEREYEGNGEKRSFVFGKSNIWIMEIFEGW